MIEPPDYSIVLDVMGDAWQRRGDAWHCAIGGNDWSYWSWQQLEVELGPLTLVLEGRDDEPKEPW